MSAESGPRRSQRSQLDNSPQPGTPRNRSGSSSATETPSSSAKRKNNVDAEPPTKRLKSTPAKPVYTKHPRFWALDGNILIQIDSTRFKLHRSRLASHSPWFEKLFERRSGQDVRVQEEECDSDSADINDVRIEETDGYDLYYLDSTGVMVEDFETLLTAMEDCIVYYFHEPDFLTVAAIFRAASLFRFQKMLDFAREYLNNQFSSQIDMIEEEPLPHAAEAVLLGRSWNLGTILKRAFYELAKRKSLRSTVESSDGQGSDGGSEPDEEDDDDDDAINELHPKDLIRIADGQKKLMSAWLSAVSLSDLKCPVKPPCGSSKARSTWDIVSPQMTAYQFDPINGIASLMNLDWKKKGYCEQCANARVKSLQAQREELWENVSVWFDLDPE